MTTSACRRAGRQRGFALLIVLWTLALLSLLVSAITAAGGGRARQAGEFSRNATLRACADGGVDQALFHVLDPSGARWPADGQVRRLNGEGCALLVSVTSQDGRINPNVASAALLTGLLRAVGTDARLATRIAAAMVAWRFPSGQTQPSPGLDYRPPGSPFESLDEIGLVPGMTRALLQRIAPALSLYHDGDPNLADAEPLVRQAVALSAGAATGPDNGDSTDAAPTAPTASGGDRFDPAVVAVAVDASDKAGHRFRRRAVVLTGSSAGRDPSGAAYPYRIVAWDAP